MSLPDMHGLYICPSAQGIYIHIKVYLNAIRPCVASPQYSRQQREQA